jgi:hypothetical protein
MGEGPALLIIANCKILTLVCVDCKYALVICVDGKISRIWVSMCKSLMTAVDWSSKAREKKCFQTLNLKSMITVFATLVHVYM